MMRRGSWVCCSARLMLRARVQGRGCRPRCARWGGPQLRVPLPRPRVQGACEAGRLLGSRATARELRASARPARCTRSRNRRLQPERLPSPTSQPSPRPASAAQRAGVPRPIAAPPPRAPRVSRGDPGSSLSERERHGRGRRRPARAQGCATGGGGERPARAQRRLLERSPTLLPLLARTGIWSPTGGFYADPKHWKRNTALVVGWVLTGRERRRVCVRACVRHPWSLLPLLLSSEEGGEREHTPPALARLACTP